jgi:hypothetical protein
VLFVAFPAGKIPLAALAQHSLRWPGGSWNSRGTTVSAKDVLLGCWQRWTAGPRTGTDCIYWILLYLRSYPRNKYPKLKRTWNTERSIDLLYCDKFMINSWFITGPRFRTMFLRAYGVYENNCHLRWTNYGEAHWNCPDLSQLHHQPWMSDNSCRVCQHDIYPLVN